MNVGRFRPIATASMGALTSEPPVPVKRTVGFVVVDMALAAATKTAHALITSCAAAVDQARLLVQLLCATDRDITRSSQPAAPAKINPSVATHTSPSAT